MTPLVLRRLALASLVANVGIVITGGAVRLTGSGLGCPTWPKCTDTSYAVTPEMGGHGLIEFGNRLLGGLVGLIAIAVLVVAVRVARTGGPRVVGLAALTLAGVLGQGVLGGITVLTQLNPWTVAGHFLVSMAVIAAAHALWRRTGYRKPSGWAAPGPVIWLVRAVTGAAAAVLVAGTVVTGSGPHAGDPDTPRMGYDAQTVAQFHADLVFLLLGLTIGCWLALRAAGAPAAAVRAAAVLLGVELAQGLIGFVQYALHLPVPAVALHMAGACAVWLGVLALADRVGSHHVTNATERGMMTTCPPPRPDGAAPPAPSSANSVPTSTVSTGRS